MRTLLLRLAAATTLCFILAGCGYKLGPVKPAVLANVNNLYIPTFYNDTLEPRIEVLVTNTVIQQFHQDGTYRITNFDQADAILECTVKELRRRPQRSVRGDVLATAEFEINLLVEYELKSQATGAPLLVGTVRGDADFFVGDDVQQEERQAIPVAAERLAVDLVSQISEGW